MLLDTRTLALRKAVATDATDSTFPARPFEIERPVRDGVHTLTFAKSAGPNSILVMPYLTGDANDDFNLRILGWSICDDEKTWANVNLCEVTATAGTATGVAGGLVDASDLFADTIALVTGNEDVTIDIVSPADNTTAHFAVDTKGSQLVEFIFNDGTGSPTGMNALWRPL